MRRWSASFDKHESVATLTAAVTSVNTPLLADDDDDDEDSDIGAHAIRIPNSTVAADVVRNSDDIEYDDDEDKDEDEVFMRGWTATVKTP